MPPPTSYHKLSLEVIRSLSGHAHSAHAYCSPDSKPAADRGSCPSPTSAKGRVSPLQPVERKPSAGTVKGRASPSQLSAHGVAEGQPSLAPAKGSNSPAGLSHGLPQNSSGQMQPVPGVHHSASAHDKHPSYSSEKLISAGTKSGKSGSAVRRAAVSGGSKSAQSKTASKASTAAKSSHCTAHLSTAAKTATKPHEVTTAVAGNSNATASSSAALEGAAACKTSSGSFTESTAGETGDSPRLTPRKWQTTFRLEDVQEQIAGVAGTAPPAVLQREATFTKNIMQQMSYNGSHEDQNHLFLEVHLLP